MSEETQGAAEVYTFAKPFTFEGQEIKELTLNFDDLSGEDIIACDRLYRAEQRGGISLAPEMDKAYQAYVVAKAAGVHVGLIRAAKAKDFTSLTLRARNFLLL
ncbi:phage tail assembly protein [Paenibacillus sp. FSL E2-8871]|uniref:phage tail assembly protein n=1 Tax=Paenibacillus sp. FSL E2-8871 TaxID=2975326 RepID=UPI0030F565E3